MKERIDKYAFFVKLLNRGSLPESPKKKDFNHLLSFQHGKTSPGGLHAGSPPFPPPRLLHACPHIALGANGFSRGPDA